MFEISRTGSKSMNEMLDKKLCEAYPKIFVNRNASVQTTSMCWGFQHGDGWYNIINNLCRCIQHHIDSTNERRELLLDENPYNIQIPDFVQQVVAHPSNRIPNRVQVRRETRQPLWRRCVCCKC